MFNTLSVLIKLDLQATRRWFEKEAIWKFLIALAFLSVMIGVGLLIYYFSLFYFKYLSEFEVYGDLTIGYVLRATILIIAWIGILSSFIGTLTFLLSPNKVTDNLVTLPIDPLNIISWQIVKTFVLNLSLFLITIFPLALSYFSGRNISLADSIFRSVSVLLILSLLVESLGSAFAYIIANSIKKKEGPLYLFGAALVFLLGTILVYFIIFPGRLDILSEIEIENFAGVFNNLPLMRSCFIANSLTGILENGFGTHYLSIASVTSLLLIMSILIQRMLFITSWQQVRLDLNLPKIKIIPTKVLTLNLIKKDILSILRSPKELGYGIFLFLMLIIFLSLFARGIEVNRIPTRFTSSAVVFSWFWLIFYSGTYIIRLVFPLMAREGRTRWWLFSLPIKTARLVESKTLAGLLISLPLLLVGFIEWSLSPIGTPNLYLLASGSLVIIWLALSLTLIGMINPDYTLGDDPEKVSTGFAGLTALGIVVLAGTALSYLINLSAKGDISLSDSLGMLFIAGLATLAPLLLVALRSTEKHTVEV